MLCDKHPEAEAFHQCTLCGKWHCEPCLKPIAVEGHSKPILSCPGCGGLARVAMERVPAPRDDLLDVARRPFTGDGPVTLIALAAPAGLTVLPYGPLQMLFSAIYVGCLAAYYFQTVDHIGRGTPGLPFSSDLTSKWEVAGALARGLACMAVGIGPAVMWGAFVPGLPVVNFFLLALGLSLAPAAILAVSISRSALAALWPFYWARIISRAPAAYARLVGLFVLSGVVWVVGVALSVSTLGGIPAFGPYLVGLVNATLALLQATLVGGFLRRNAAELGWE